MIPIGFSTGALFKDQLEAGVELAAQLSMKAIELSALRVPELHHLAEFVTADTLPPFEYVSVHAPIDYAPEQESTVAGALLRIANHRGWPVVVHPDVIADFSVWEPFGRLLCIENMDKRKSAGRTAEELALVFERLPMASFCFDIAHAHQVDATMTEAYRLLRVFGSRLTQVHMSELTGSGKHARLSTSALKCYDLVASYLPVGCPVILESPASSTDATDELQKVYSWLSHFQDSHVDRLPA